MRNQLHAIIVLLWLWIVIVNGSVAARIGGALVVQSLLVAFRTLNCVFFYIIVAVVVVCWFLLWTQWTPTSIAPCPFDDRYVAMIHILCVCNAKWASERVSRFAFCVYWVNPDKRASCVIATARHSNSHQTECMLLFCKISLEWECRERFDGARIRVYAQFFVLLI